MTASAPVLSAQNVRKRLRRRQVLEDITLELHAGEIIGISGQNGSGKTTLMQILAGVLRADSGHVHRRTTLGYAPQIPLLYEHLTVWEHFAYVAAAHSIHRHKWESQALKLLDVYCFANWKADKVAALSGGTRQKLNLALALLSDPAVLLLDEPYGGFEWDTYLRFWEEARAQRDAGKSVVVVSHLFYDRSQLDRIVELREGRAVV